MDEYELTLREYFLSNILPRDVSRTCDVRGEPLSGSLLLVAQLLNGLCITDEYCNRILYKGNDNSINRFGSVVLYGEFEGLCEVALSTT